MRKITPDISFSPPQENYRYYDARGLPYTGEYSPMRQDEYLARTAVVARVGFGNFDTAQVDQKHFGRTLNEVLVKVMVGEYKMLQHREQWVTCPKFGVRVMQYVQWLEYSDRPTTESIRTASSSTIVNNFMQG